MAKTYLPFADLILLVGRGDDLGFLKPEVIAAWNRRLASHATSLSDRHYLLIHSAICQKTSCETTMLPMSPY